MFIYSFAGYIDASLQKTRLKKQIRILQKNKTCQCVFIFAGYIDASLQKTRLKKQIRIPQKNETCQCLFIFAGHIDASLQYFQFSILKKGVTLFQSNTPIMNYALNQALRFYSMTGRTL